MRRIRRLCTASTRQAVYETVQTYSHTWHFGESLNRAGQRRPTDPAVHHVEGVLKCDGALLVLDAAFQVAATYAISCITSPACYDRKSLLNPPFFCVS